MLLWRFVAVTVSEEWQGANLEPPGHWQSVKVQATPIPPSLKVAPTTGPT